MSELLVNLGNQTKMATVIAILTIMIVGLFKFIPALKNMQNKNLRKAIYQVMSLAISSGLAIAYQLWRNGGQWSADIAAFITIAMAQVNIIYPLYENLGIRALVKLLAKVLIPSKSKKVDQVVDSIPTVEEPTRPTSEEVAQRQKQAEQDGWLK